MEILENQLIETWFINHRTNVMLLEALTEDALLLTTSKRGGGKIGHQLAHMYNVRYWKLKKFNKELVAELQTIKATDKKNIPMLMEAHSLSADLVGEMLKTGIAGQGKVKGFKRGVIPLLGYFIHHEAHHRGNIMLTLKRCGFKLPDQLKYGIWEWNKL